MTSTRNKNTPQNYCLEQRNNSLANIYTHYTNSSYGNAHTNAFPCLGITPSHMPRNTLSYNPIEIESYLFGISSTNLVHKQSDIVPEFKSVPIVSYFDRLPLIMPEPLVIQSNQRPFPVPE
jgi:hypothetical protein